MQEAVLPIFQRAIITKGRKLSFLNQIYRAFILTRLYFVNFFIALIFAVIRLLLIFYKAEEINMAIEIGGPMSNSGLKK